MCSDFVDIRGKKRIKSTRVGVMFITARLFVLLLLLLFFCCDRLFSPSSYRFETTSKESNGALDALS